MIDAARALAANLAVAEDAASDLADHVVREVERLDALRAALAAFIEQGAPADQGQPAVGLRTDGEPTLDPVASPSRPPKKRSTGGRTEQPAAGQGPPDPSPSPAILLCGCGFIAKTPNGLGVHKARSHRKPMAEAALTEAAEAPTVLKTLGAHVDRRIIDEECPKGCGQRFTWEPRLYSHVGSCTGKRST